MEYAENGDLFDYVNDKKYLHEYCEEETLVKWLKQASQALHYIHLNNGSHRDIKL